MRGVHTEGSEDTPEAADGDVSGDERVGRERAWTWRLPPTPPPVWIHDSGDVSCCGDATSHFLTTEYLLTWMPNYFFCGRSTPELCSDARTPAAAPRPAAVFCAGLRLRSVCRSPELFTGKHRRKEP